MMDCAGFERGLMHLASDDLDGATRDRMRGELRRHAESCPDCAWAAALLKLLEQPRGERELVTDPGPEYWSGFEGRVRARIDREHAVPRPSAIRAWLGVAAAAVVVAIAFLWVLREPAAPWVPTELTEPDPAVLPRPLEERLTEVSAGDVLAEVDAMAGWGGEWESGVDTDAPGFWGAAGPFPDVSDLDEEASQALLRWLNEQSS